MTHGKTMLGKILTVFGDLKIYSWPMWLVYAPEPFGVTGIECRHLQSVLRPGDIVLRGYRNYLDGHFIPGFFTHAGTYVGPLTEDEYKTARGYDGDILNFASGQMVIHAVADGVMCEDILEFARCDHLAVLRLPDVVSNGSHHPKSLIPIEEFSSLELDIYSELKAGGEVTRGEIVPVIVQNAISKIGTPYDFSFDFADFNSFCCSEFSYWAMKCCAPFLDLVPITRRVLGIKKRMLPPDDMIESGMALTWYSRSSIRNLVGREVLDVTGPGDVV